MELTRSPAFMELRSRTDPNASPSSAPKKGGWASGNLEIPNYTFAGILGPGCGLQPDSRPPKSIHYDGFARRQNLRGLGAHWPSSAVRRLLRILQQGKGADGSRGRPLFRDLPDCWPFGVKPFTPTLPRRRAASNLTRGARTARRLTSPPVSLPAPSELAFCAPRWLFPDSAIRRRFLNACPDSQQRPREIPPPGVVRARCAYG